MRNNLKHQVTGDWCLFHFSYCFCKVSSKSNLRKGSFWLAVWAHTVCRGWEQLLEPWQQECAHCLCSQEAERCRLGLTHFLSRPQPMAGTTIWRLGLPSLSKALCRHPRRCARWCASWAVPNLVRLTKINHFNREFGLTRILYSHEEVSLKTT